MDSFGSMCRLCLKSCRGGVDLFTSGNGYSEQLQDIFQIQLLPIDQWPSNACKDCINSLDEASELKKRIALTQRQLHDLISEVKVEGDTFPDESDDEEKPVFPEVYFDSPPDASDIEDIKPEVTTPADGPQMKKLRARPSTSKTTPPTRTKRLKKKNTQEQKKDIQQRRIERAAARIPLDEMMRTLQLFDCHICKHTNTSFDDLNQHMKLAHTRQSGYIFCCEKKFSQTYAYDHMAYHLDENKFSCDVCGKKCTTARELKFHKMTHSNLPTRKCICEICGKPCKDKYSVQKHQQSHMTLEERGFKCNYCGKFLYDQKNLQSHINSLHEKIATHICEKCGMGYANSELLKEHFKRVHTERITKRCPICQKFFFKLRTHTVQAHADLFNIETHTKCKECGKDVRKKSFNAHMKYYHSDYKKPKCEYCDKEFRTPKQHQAHMNIHLGIRRPCHFCPFSAVESGNLVVHMKAKHPVEYAEFKAKKFSEPRTKVDQSAL